MNGGYIKEKMTLNSSTISISGGYFGEDAYNSSDFTITEKLTENKTIVVLSDTQYYGDLDYVSGFPYAVYSTGAVSGSSISETTVTCDDASSYTPIIENAPSNWYDVDYSYEDNGNTINSLPTSIGEYHVTATITEIDGANKFYNTGTITFTVKIEHKDSTYTKKENGTHDFTCTGCSTTLSNEPCSYDDHYVSDGDNGCKAYCACGNYITIPHKYADGDSTYYDGTQHYKECINCNYRNYQNHVIIEGEYQIGSSGHYQECEYCTYTTTETAHSYTDHYDQISNDTTQHTAYCACGQSITENCNYIQNDHTWTCACGNSYTTDHSYTYTATADGMHSYSCSICTDSGTEPHDFSIHTNDGHTFTCKCGESLTSDHYYTYIEYEDYHTYKCEICGDTDSGTHNYTEPVDSHTTKCVCGATHTTEHTYDSNYINDGDEHYRTCSICVEREYSGHTYNIGTNDPHTYECICGDTHTSDHTYSDNYTDNGENHYQECSICGDELYNEHEHTYIDNGEDGHYGVCSCGNTTEVESHNYGEWETTIEPTSDTEGEESRACKDCGHIETNTLEATGDTTGDTTTGDTTGGDTTTTNNSLAAWLIIIIVLECLVIIGLITANVIIYKNKDEE